MLMWYDVIARRSVAECCGNVGSKNGELTSDADSRLTVVHWNKNMGSMSVEVVGVAADAALNSCRWFRVFSCLRL